MNPGRLTRLEKGIPIVPTHTLESGDGPVSLALRFSAHLLPLYFLSVFSPMYQHTLTQGATQPAEQTLGSS